VLVGDLLEDVIALDGRLPRTLHGLLRPGHLTREYAAGRIMRYVRPFKLYLACSIIFFLALSISLKFDIPDEVVRSLPIPAAKEAMPPEELNITRASAAESNVERADIKESPLGSASDSVTTDTTDMAAVSEPRTRKRRAFYELVLLPFTEKVSDNPRAAKDLVDRMLRDAPKAVFILLPIFALFLKILYIRRRRLYVEHLVFILHAHAFGFLLAAPLLLVPDSWPTGLLWLALPAYLLWAMRRVYGQSWKRTILKFCIFGWVYFISVVISLVTVTILAAMAVGGTFSF
jgi:hypothetical protein